MDITPILLMRKTEPRRGTKATELVAGRLAPLSYIDENWSQWQGGKWMAPSFLGGLHCLRIAGATGHQLTSGLPPSGKWPHTGLFLWGLTFPGKRDNSELQLRAWWADPGQCLPEAGLSPVVASRGGIPAPLGAWQGDGRASPHGSLEIWDISVIGAWHEDSAGLSWTGTHRGQRSPLGKHPGE